MQGNDCNKCQDSVTFWAREEIVIRIGHTEGLFGWLAGKVFPDLSAITTVSLLLIIYCHPLLQLVFRIYVLFYSWEKKAFLIIERHLVMKFEPFPIMMIVFSPCYCLLLIYILSSLENMGSAKLPLPVQKETHQLLSCNFSFFQRVFKLNHPQDLILLCSAHSFPFSFLLLFLLVWPMECQQM